MDVKDTKTTGASEVMAENKVKTTDEEILALSLGTPSAFSMLIDRYQDAFIRTAMKIVRQREEAEDVVQETFVKIYMNAARFRKMENAGFKSWAYKILSNTAFNHYKKLKRNLEKFEYFNPVYHDCVNEDVLSEELESRADMKSLVSRVLGKLPEHLGAVLKKYYIEDKSQKHIASEEGVSITTIKMRLFRAKKAFKKLAGSDKTLSWT